MNLTAQEAALAWGQMKDVQVRLMSGEWVSIPKPGQTAINKPGWTLGANLFHATHNAGPFRLAAEPKLRPLTIEEWRKRIGSVVLNKASPNEYVSVLGVSVNDLWICGNPLTNPQTMLDRWTFADGSPCGVMEGGAA